VDGFVLADRSLLRSEELLNGNESYGESFWWCY
jgi:hypothetical protein